MNYEEAIQSNNDNLWNKDQENVVYPIHQVFKYKLNKTLVLVNCNIFYDNVDIKYIEYRGVDITPIVDEEELYHIKLKAKETL